MNRCPVLFFGWYTLVFLLGAASFLIMLASDITGIGRTVAKAIPVATLLVLVIRDMHGFGRICLAGAMAWIFSGIFYKEASAGSRRPDSSIIIARCV